MWRVLDEALAVDGEEERKREEKAIGRRETRRVLAAFRAGLAVWDVAADVHVPGEKRRATATKGERALNDVLGFLKARPSVTAVAFVGEKAWRAFRSASENAAATRETFSNQSSAPRRRWIAVDGRAVAVAVRSARGDERERREKVREWSEALFGKEGEEAERGESRPSFEHVRFFSASLASNTFGTFLNCFGSARGSQIRRARTICLTPVEPGAGAGAGAAGTAAQTSAMMSEMSGAHRVRGRPERDLRLRGRLGRGLQR